MVLSLGVPLGWFIHGHRISIIVIGVRFAIIFFTIIIERSCSRRAVQVRHFALQPLWLLPMVVDAVFHPLLIWSIVRPIHLIAGDPIRTLFLHNIHRESAHILGIHRSIEQSNGFRADSPLGDIPKPGVAAADALAVDLDEAVRAAQSRIVGSDEEETELDAEPTNPRVSFIDEVKTVGWSLIARRKLWAGQEEVSKIDRTSTASWDCGREYLGLMFETLDWWFVGIGVSGIRD